MGFNDHGKNEIAPYVGKYANGRDTLVLMMYIIGSDWSDMFSPFKTNNSRRGYDSCEVVRMVLSVRSSFPSFSSFSSKEAGCVDSGTFAVFWVATRPTPSKSRNRGMSRSLEDEFILTIEGRVFHPRISPSLSRKKTERLTDYHLLLSITGNVLCVNIF